MNNLDNKKKKVAVGVIFIIIAATIFGIYHFYFNLNRITTDDAYVEGKIYTIASKVAGTVGKVLVTDNQFVKKDEVILEIDPIDLEARLNEVTASLRAEEARLQDARLSIKTAQESFKIQKASYQQAKIDIERAKKLFKDGAMSREKLEKTQTAYNVASATLSAAKEQINRAIALKALQESIVAQKEAALKIAELNVTYTKIRASGDGFITKKAIEEGNQIQAGQPLMALVSLEDVWIIANYKETQVKNFRPGQKVVIRVDTYPDKKFSGKVESIMAGTGSAFSLFPPENALGNYVKVVQRIPVKILIDKDSDPTHILRIGMSVVPAIITSHE